LRGIQGAEGPRARERGEREEKRKKGGGVKMRVGKVRGRGGARRKGLRGGARRVVRRGGVWTGGDGGLEGEGEGGGGGGGGPEKSGTGSGSGGKAGRERGGGTEKGVWQQGKWERGQAMYTCTDLKAPCALPDDGCDWRIFHVHNMIRVNLYR